MRETSRRQRLAVILSSVAAIAASALSGCSGSAALPARPQAFRQAEAYINDVLLALHEQPTTQSTYLDGPCHETDDAHGGFDLEYTVPGTQRPAQVQAELKAVRSMMQSLGTPTPASSGQGVSVNSGSYHVFFDATGGVLGISVQSCYSTPATTVVIGQTLTVSPAPTSTATSPTG